MKIMQIKDGSCWWDATDTIPSIEEVHEMFSSDMVFVEAPDWVFEGWGYDEHAEGDARFLKPEPPDGYLYDEATGTFYPSSKTRAELLTETIETMRDMLARAEAQLAALKEVK